jgi:hypothetical protein
MAMTNYWAVLSDETGMEFGAGVTAPDRATAYEMLRDNYPESHVVQLESPEDTARRKAEIYARVSADYDDFYDDYEYEDDL